jgi:uncharacterized protein
VTALHTVDVEGRYDGRSLRDALPLVVGEIVAAIDPLEIILFGSVARGDEGPDSDLDLLVVLDHADRLMRRRLMREVRGAIRTFVPVDVVIADSAELAADRDAVGSVVYWPLREGQTLYRRSAERVG